MQRPSESASQAGRFCDLPLERRLLDGRAARVALLVAGCALIPLWQLSFARRAEQLDPRYRQQACSGLQHPDGIQAPGRFVYFLYYLGLYPVMAELDESQLVWSRQGAEQVIADHGETLVMELGHATRSAEPGRILLYLPDAWLKGRPESPSVRPCHAVAFAVGLVTLFVAFWWVRQPVLGVLVVAFLGSNPFQLFEVYANENVFGWPITTCMLLLAIHLPLLRRGRPSRAALWAAPIVSGIVVATVRQLRPEPAAMILSAGLCYLTVSATRWRVRLALVGLLAGTFLGASKGWEAYFRRQHERALATVEAAGGHPYRGPSVHYHGGLSWHILWCGLGDFGRDRGYLWNDAAAVAYARAAIRERYDVELPPWDGTSLLCTDTYWDDARKYYRMAHEVPHYQEALRRKVLGDIARDPLWYAGILARRAWRIVAETTPVRLSWGTAGLTVPMHGAVALPVLALLLWGRCWPTCKLIAFSLPLSLTALAVYSGRGTCYYSCYHILVAAVLGAWVVEGALWCRKWRASQGAAGTASGERSGPRPRPPAEERR